MLAMLLLGPVSGMGLPIAEEKLLLRRGEGRQELFSHSSKNGQRITVLLGKKRDVS